MNCVNFNVSTPNVNYARLSDESTDKPIEQVNFKANAGMNAVNNLQKTCKKGLSIKGFFENLKLRIENYRTQRKLMKVIEETKDQAFKNYVKTLSPSVRKELYNAIALDYVAFELPLNVLNKNRTFGSFASLAEQTKKARSKSVGQFFKNFGNLFKKS